MCFPFSIIDTGVYVDIDIIESNLFVFGFMSALERVKEL